MDMTLEQYIANPMGKNNAVLNGLVRENIRKMYTHKFDNILLREHGKIEYYLYTAQNNVYWVHIKVPSEVVDKFYYDVVFKFYTGSDVGGAGEDLFKYNVNFFSNDPNFVFTYAHVFAKNDIFIKELRSKMSKIAIKKPPKEKNPNEDVGYVKAIYFAYLVMQNKKLNKLSRFRAECRTLDPKKLLSDIEEADIKIAQRQEEGSKVSRKKKIDVSSGAAKKALKLAGDNANFSRLQVTTTKKIGSIQNKAQISSVKSTKSTKRK